MMRSENTTFEKLNFLYKTNLTVLANHVGHGGHLKSDGVIALINEARIEFLTTHDLSEVNMIGNVSLLISKLQAEYKSEGYFDEELIIEIYASYPLKKASCLLYYKVLNKI